MCNAILLLLLFIMPSVLFGGEADVKPEAKSEGKADFFLTIKDNLISLNAKDALLKEVIEEIGRRMKIEVIAHIPEEEKVTIEFEGLSIRDAIERVSTNYVYLMDSEKGRSSK